MKLVSADAILEISKYTIVVHDKLLFKKNIELTALSLKLPQLPVTMCMLNWAFQ